MLHSCKIISDIVKKDKLSYKRKKAENERTYTLAKKKCNRKYLSVVKKLLPCFTHFDHLFDSRGITNLNIKLGEINFTGSQI